ncbi:TetR/AcrR family transcriptional regulator [Microbacterium galbinum]|uniref:TetR/AcrR family transcriptional regulator n=1 Tax=Microbacterium galbinum TaxID=2851646 RepID=A0ABY4IP12_9MICO|nr:TetR/AcrR family transcriptional regulator [Microbacterium galbinum]UPL13782.1 TetR/AcrR family transcriptional regulator [Microbacterium galbinum]
MSSSKTGYHHGDLARALEDAAMQLLERMPAADISLREVARAADVSHNAPYHHFSDRLGLLKAIAERSMADLLAQVQNATTDAATPRAALAAGGEAYIRFAVEHPHAFDAVYDPTVCVPGSPTATMAPLIDALEGALAAAAAATGLDRPTDVVALWGLIHGLGTLAAAGHFGLDDALASYEALLGRLLSAGV